MTATVLIPSYRRSDSLIACLDAVLGGTRLPEQIVVVLRDSDEESHHALQAWRERAGQQQALVELVEVSEPGQIAATNAGLAQARGDVVCFLDDDCRPTEQWLERIMAWYQDATVVGVGGRDIVHHGAVISARPSSPVGHITWYGRVIGNHHQPRGDHPREVHHLKGANMSFRRAVLPGFDTRLLGAHLSDTNASLVARAAGGRLIFDPLAAVHHYPAPRPHQYARTSRTPQQIFADAHDWAYVMLRHLPPLGRLAFWGYALLVGQDRRYGLLKMLAALPRAPRVALRVWWHTLRGLRAGARDAREARL